MTVSLSDVVLIVDARGLPAAERLVDVAHCSCIGLEDEATAQALSGRPLVIDVGLSNVANVRTLRRLLPRLEPDSFRIFAVDQHQRIEQVHAHILGATGTISRPLALPAIVAKLEARARSGGDLGPSPGRGSIATAASAIGAMFAGLVTDGEYCAEVVAEAGAEVVGAIEDIGFSRWVDTVRQHHEGTFQHCLIVTGVMTAFARATGMSRRDVELLTVVGLLHDVGKARVPVEVLEKPMTLTDREVSLIRTHPDEGYRYLKEAGGIDDDVLFAVRHHHEMLDGSGYPDGLMGSAIGDITRILTVCDVYGALVERRAYKQPLSREHALAALDQMASESRVEGSLVRALHHAVLN